MTREPGLHRIAALVLAGFTLAAPAGAQNLLLNSDFDTTVDLAVWVDGAELIAWDMLDVDSSPSSGSARVTQSQTGTTGLLHQGVLVQGNASYTLEGCGLIQSGQTGVGYFEVGINWWQEACGTFTTHLGFESPGIVSSPLDSWECRALQVVAPATAQCGRVALFMRNNSGSGPFSVHFDAIALPEAGQHPSTAAGLVALGALARRRRTSWT